ncbi:hypothetical protein SH601_09605 [Gracilibacillus sp. S3-1-1]|uniref:Uncharacterized protein n=1 Tax=Gracilibacillus pellucidus TaxID=3095368 RepID=A0ACC6M5T3_9BACI|nr:hypothetical protein [Gracilibacillus sp. S3-1-1]MDX8046246.1 hypothetical protein [Gracilibacillus sp. S3-1-1]
MSKKYLLLIFLSMIVFITACNDNELQYDQPESQNDESELDRLFHLYPEIEKEYNQIPEEIKEEIVVPSLENIPFEVEEISLTYKESGDQNLPSARLSYMGNSNYVSVNVWKYPEEKTTFRKMHPIMLKQNMHAYYRDEGLDKLVQWENPTKKDLLHHVVLTKYGENQDNGYEFTIDEAIDIANSALDNGANE